MLPVHFCPRVPAPMAAGILLGVPQNQSPAGMPTGMPALAGSTGGAHRALQLPEN